MICKKTLKTFTALKPSIRIKGKLDTVLRRGEKREKRREKPSVREITTVLCRREGIGGGDGEEGKKRTRANEKFRIAVNFVRRRRHNETAVVNCEHFISKNLNFKRAVFRKSWRNKSAPTVDEAPGVHCTRRDAAYHRHCSPRNEKLVVHARLVALSWPPVCPEWNNAILLGNAIYYGR